MKPIQILLVEDNEGDILLTKEALEESKVLNELKVLRNGKDALDFLLKVGKFADAERPDLILLDINLPLKNGIEVLKYIKTTDSIKEIPVVMLTTSSTSIDIQNAYRNYANCYITKPVDVMEFMKSVMGIGEFWFNIVKLPPKI